MPALLETETALTVPRTCVNAECMIQVPAGEGIPIFAAGGYACSDHCAMRWEELRMARELEAFDSSQQHITQLAESG